MSSFIVDSIEISDELSWYLMNFLLLLLIIYITIIINAVEL